ncbi:MAG TPA: DUF3048 domain-containing protein [Candidatus Saccharimonadales bacterium]|nr:DUF3048 domain-containing protein [Candidatus Saccharimonadales bacterium]
MQGDINLPSRPKRPKPAPTPKITHQPAPAPRQAPDFSIDEADLDAPKGKKQRKVLIAPHKHFKRFWGWWTSQSRNVRFGIIALLLLLFGGGAIIWFSYIQPGSNPTLSIIHHPKKKPTTVASPLTGVQVSPTDAARPVTAIMIENSQDARPQSGLQDAGVVYEAIAEAGITRFMALYQEGQPQYIGPVRSLRPYYIDFAAPFQASIVHVGGSPDALSVVTSGNFRNLDQFYNGSYFTRVNSRYAPHNVYTSFAKLDALNQAKGYTKSSFTSWLRKSAKKLKVPTAKTIHLAISSPDFYADYSYDAASNSYLRSEGGQPHTELVNAGDTTGPQLHPKVVIALVMSLSNGALDSSGAYYSEYQDTGSGPMYVFQDGGVSQGTWSKSDTTSQFSFTDSSGAPIKLDAGQTWITIVGDPSQVTYSP